MTALWATAVEESLPLIDEEHQPLTPALGLDFWWGWISVSSRAPEPKDGPAMRRSFCALAGTLAALTVFAASAGAESTTVKGTSPGDITKMSVNNAKTALTVKVYGLFGKNCNSRSVSSFRVTVGWGQAAYRAEANCYAGETPRWITGLYYVADGADGSGGKKVTCPKFQVTYDAMARAYRVFFPRTCMSRAADRVKVRSEGLNSGSAAPGAAGPTRALRRG